MKKLLTPPEPLTTVAAAAKAWFDQKHLADHFPTPIVPPGASESVPRSRPNRSPYRLVRC